LKLKFKNIWILIEKDPKKSDEFRVCVTDDNEAVSDRFSRDELRDMINTLHSQFGGAKRDWSGLGGNPHVEFIVEEYYGDDERR
jgi:hypothetical protein